MFYYIGKGDDYLVLLTCSSFCVLSIPVNALESEFGSGGSSGGPGVSISEITGQQSASSTPAASRQVSATAEAAASSAAAVEPPSETGSTGSGQLLSLEPPLASSDYSFSLDDQENLNDLFELF